MSLSPDVTSAIAAVADLSAEFSPPLLDDLTADELLEAQRMFAEVTRRAQACAEWLRGASPGCRGVISATAG